VSSRLQVLNLRRQSYSQLNISFRKNFSFKHLPPMCANYTFILLASLYFIYDHWIKPYFDGFNILSLFFFQLNALSSQIRVSRATHRCRRSCTANSQLLDGIQASIKEWMNPSSTQSKMSMFWGPITLCLRSEVAFLITCVANLIEVKVLYVQQDLRHEISGYWRFYV
jgi:hypothetical protein